MLHDCAVLINQFRWCLDQRSSQEFATVGIVAVGHEVRLIGVMIDAVDCRFELTVRTYVSNLLTNELAVLDVFPDIFQHFVCMVENLKDIHNQP